MPATEVIVLNYSCSMTLKEILGLPDIELILLFQSRHHNYSQGDIMTCGENTGKQCVAISLIFLLIYNNCCISEEYIIAVVMITLKVWKYCR